MDLPGSSSILNKEVSVCRCLHDNRGWEIEESSIWKVENQGIRWLKFISGSKTTSRAWNYTTQWSKFYVKSSFLRTGSRNIQGQKRMKVKSSLFPFWSIRALNRWDDAHCHGWGQFFVFYKHPHRRTLTYTITYPKIILSSPGIHTHLLKPHLNSK